MTASTSISPAGCPSPPFKDMLTVQVDREIAQAFLDEHEIRAAVGSPSSSRVQAKLAYYRRLVQRSLPQLHRLDLKLRRDLEGLRRFRPLLPAACRQREAPAPGHGVPPLPLCVFPAPFADAAETSAGAA